MTEYVRIVNPFATNIFSSVFLGIEHSKNSRKAVKIALAPTPIDRTSTVRSCVGGTYTFDGVGTRKTRPDLIRTPVPCTTQPVQMVALMQDIHALLCRQMRQPDMDCVVIPPVP